MKLHLSDIWHPSHKEHSERYDNIKYGLMLVLAIPVVTFGSKYLVEAAFRMFG